MAELVKWPAGPATLVAPEDITIETNATTVRVLNSKTIIDMGVFNDDTTLNLDIDKGMVIGSELIVKAGCDTTPCNLLFGTGILSDDVSLNDDKVRMLMLVFDGTQFVASAGVAMFDAP